MDSEKAEKILNKIMEKYDIDYLINNSLEAPDEVRKIISDLNNLWSVYGNNGEKHTLGNHRFIQKLINTRSPSYDFSRLSDMKGSPSRSATKECQEKVDSLIRKLEEFCNE